MAQHPKPESLATVLATFPQTREPTKQEAATLINLIQQAQLLLKEFLEADAAAYTSSSSASTITIASSSPSSLPTQFKYIERTFGASNRDLVKYHFEQMQNVLGYWRDYLASLGTFMSFGVSGKIIVSEWLDKFKHGASTNGRGKKAVLNIPQAMAQVNNDNIITLIHEASHAAEDDPTVIDIDYLTSPSFAYLSKDKRIHNAAHYEAAFTAYINRNRLSEAEFSAAVGDPDNPPASSSSSGGSLTATTPYDGAVRAAQNVLMNALIQSQAALQAIVESARKNVSLGPMILKSCAPMNLSFDQNAWTANFGYAWATVETVKKASAFTEGITMLRETLWRATYDPTGAAGKCEIVVVNVAPGKTEKKVRFPSSFAASPEDLIDLVLGAVYTASLPPVDSGVTLAAIHQMSDVYREFRK